MREKVIVTMINCHQDISDFMNRLTSMGNDAKWVPLNNTNEVMKVIDAVYGSDYVFIGGEIWNKDVMDAIGNRLKLIIRIGTGYDKIDLDAATQKGIAVANTPNLNSFAVAEHALSMMLGLLKRTYQYDREMRVGIWNPDLSNDLTKKTVGFIGFGSIPKALSRLLLGFSCQLLAYDLYHDEKAAKELNVSFVNLEQLLANSDIVSLHLPLCKATAGFVDQKFLSKMKPSAILINTSRGQLIQEKDLITALENQTIAGAALDVFEIQPLPAENKLIKMNNVALSPHTAAVSHQAFDSLLNGSLRILTDFVQGRKLDTILNPEYINFRGNEVSFRS